MGLYELDFRVLYQKVLRECHLISTKLCYRGMLTQSLNEEKQNVLLGNG